MLTQSLLIQTTVSSNTSESDPHSYEATKAVAKKAQKMGFKPMTSVIPVQYQLSYEALLGVGSRASSIYSHNVYMI